jgi:hypothetical protein
MLEKLQEIQRLIIAQGDPEAWVTLDVAQTIMGRTDQNKRYITRLAMSGKVDAKKTDGRWYISKQSLYDYMAGKNKKREKKSTNRVIINLNKHGER